MPTLNSFVRFTPPEMIRAILIRENIDLPGDMTWNGSSDLGKAILSAVDKLELRARGRFLSRAERISDMADEGGETAIYAVAPDRQVLDGQPNRQARAAWLFLNEPVAFRRAEEVRFADERRGGQMWDGFSGPQGLQLSRDGSALESFKAALREHFDSPNIHIEVFDRHRAAFEEDDRALVQVTIYREGRPDELLEFTETGILGKRTHRPVHEAALTYEPATGAIEVVAQQRPRREELARLFAGKLLQSEFSEEKLPLRKYDLQSLLVRQEFPSDPGDGIESVRVNFLRLVAESSAGRRVMLECQQECASDIWAMSAEEFGANDPLRGGWRVTQAKVTIRFRRAPGSGRGRSLPVTISVPHGCDLKNRTERERLVGGKYLRRWGLVRDL